MHPPSILILHGHSLKPFPRSASADKCAAFGACLVFGIIAAAPSVWTSLILHFRNSPVNLEKVNHNQFGKGSLYHFQYICQEMICAYTLCSHSQVHSQEASLYKERREGVISPRNIEESKALSCILMHLSIYYL